ncbi:hypothetical protein HNP46_005771 [Pseudomonas nitritireducens]|uniref:Uncharacterized protein n=1 Tax=Pseudomonas nitroreducens TaxID=46680 RepID=A0A7W7KQ13_PSENT|nr:hypothetical protein [Pseudomonas nitritireducens]MBB4866864.1 hypothetical protein [Pseudomonas nitritireducens]
MSIAISIKNSLMTSTARFAKTWLWGLCVGALMLIAVECIFISASLALQLPDTQLVSATILLAIIVLGAIFGDSVCLLMMSGVSASCAFLIPSHQALYGLVALGCLASYLMICLFRFKHASD